jgi:hypothetical protein
MAEKGYKKGKGRSSGIKNISLRKLDILLHVIEDHEPGKLRCGNQSHLNCD